MRTVSQARAGFWYTVKSKHPFWGMPLSLCETEAGKVCILVFLKIDLCSATSTQSFRRDLLNDVAEHRHNIS